MKKILLLAALTVFAYGTGIGQVFYSGFETWNSPHKPASWFGVATSIDSNNVNQYTSTPQEGTYAVKLTNNTTSHKRLSTTAVSVTSGEAYFVSFYAKGNGSIRSGMYRGSTGSYVTYSAYDSINSATWVKIEQTVISDTTSSVAEFILSFRNTQTANEDLQIDSVEITIGSVSSLSIYDIQYTTDPTGNSPEFGNAINTGGIVSATKSGAYWIQNGSGPWSGVYVYESINTPSIGDSVTFTAVVDEYNSLTELKSISNFTVVSSGNTVHTTALNIPDVTAEMYEGVLVSVTNAECTAMPDTYMEWVVGDGMSTVKVGDFIYAYTPVLGTHYDITGVMDYNFDERKILPRFAADVTLYNAIDENVYPISMYPNPAESMVNIQNELNGTLVISDMTGRNVFSTFFNQSAVINTSELTSGFYTVVITGENGEKAISKLLVK